MCLGSLKLSRNFFVIIILTPLFNHCETSGAKTYSLRLLSGPLDDLLIVNTQPFSAGCRYAIEIRMASSVLMVLLPWLGQVLTHMSNKPVTSPPSRLLSF